MAQQVPPVWTFDYGQRMYYRYDAENDQFVYQDGRRYPRPSHIPRTTFLPVATSVDPSQSPPQQPSEYIHSTGRPNESGPQGSGITPYGSRSPQDAAPRTAQSTQSESGRVRVDSRLRPDQIASELGRLSVETRIPQQSQPEAYLPEPVQGQVYESNGMRMVSVVDQRNGVQTTIADRPAERITDPGLYQQGIPAHRMLFGNTAVPEERLFAGYKIRDRPGRFFVQGRVFLVLWTEPAGETNTLITKREPGLTLGRYGERVYSKVRRFVVVREAINYCSALPIVTYGGQGVGKRTVDKSEHAIIHAGDQVPEPLPAELPERGEQPMRARPIRVVPDEPRDRLDPVSRIDFGKIHTIQHNIKVKAFGMVHQHAMDALLTQFTNVWRPETAPVPQIPVIASSSRNATAQAEEDDSESDSSSGDETPPTAQPSTLSPRAQPAHVRTQQVPQPQRTQRTQLAQLAQPTQQPPLTPQPQQQQLPSQVRTSFSNLIQQGRTREQAVGYLARHMVSRDPRYTIITATNLITPMLASQLSQVTSQAPSSAERQSPDSRSGGNAKSDSSDDEDESDDDEE